MATNHASAAAATTAAAVPSGSREAVQVAGKEQAKPKLQQAFAGKCFFLEIRTSSELIRKQIKFGIEALKGSVEPFLESHVNYLVTDIPKETWPNSQNTSTENRAQTPEHSGPVAAAAPSSLSAFQRANMSRAKLMMDKSQQQNACQGNTTDVLQRALRLGVKLIDSPRMMDFLMQHVQLPGIPRRDPSPTSAKSVQVVPITGNFIKVEAMDQLSRPLAKTFRTWPELILEPGTGCPFRLTAYAPEISDRMRKEHKQKQLLQNSNSRNVTPVPSPLPSPMPSPAAAATNNLRSTPKDQQIRLRNICGGRKGTGVASWSRITPQTADPNHTGCTTAATGHFHTTNARNGHFFRGPGGQIQGAGGVKRKTMFCENCGVEFDRLSDHINSPAHQQFLHESENFKDMVSVMKSLPTLSDLIAANMPESETEKVEEEKENDQTSTGSSRRKKSRKKGKQENDPVMRQNNEDRTTTTTTTTTEEDENEGTSAYDVTHLRERMSFATIESPVVARGEPAWSILNNGHDVEI